MMVRLSAAGVDNILDYAFGDAMASHGGKGPMNWTMVTDYLDGLHAANFSAIYMLDMYSCTAIAWHQTAPPVRSAQLHTTRNHQVGGAKPPPPSWGATPPPPPVDRSSSSLAPAPPHPHPSYVDHDGTDTRPAWWNGFTSTEVVGEFVAHQGPPGAVRV